MPKFRILMCAVVLASGLVITTPPTASAHEEPSSQGRWVDFGKWNGVVACEASPISNYPHLVPRKHKARYKAEVRADIHNVWSGADGPFQFLKSTWNSVAKARGKERFIGRDPHEQTLAQQLRQAQWLRKNVGIRQWVCGYRYGDGTGPRYVTGEVRTPRYPRKCARNLRRHHGVKWRVAKSVCNLG